VPIAYINIHIGNKKRQNLQPPKSTKTHMFDHTGPYGRIRRMEDVPMDVSRFLFFGESDMFENSLVFVVSGLLCWIWSYEIVPIWTTGPFLFGNTCDLTCVFTSRLPLFQVSLVFQIIIYLQSSIMPRGSPNPVRLCRSCLRRFRDLKNTRPGFLEHVFC